MQVAKFHTLGNDFLILDPGEEAVVVDLAPFARRVLDRHTGVGADGLLLVSVRDRRRGEAGFRIFNADGSEAEVSGNGLRCAAAFLFERGLVDTGTIRFATPAGPRECDLIETNRGRFVIKVGMGAPRLSSAEIPFDDGKPHDRLIDYPLAIHRKTYPVTITSMGNPHVAVFVDRFPARIEWLELGREIESHPFFPNRTNVEFVRVRGRDEIEVLFWERGVGETMSSGTGSSAAAVAAMLKGLVGPKVAVVTALGRLQVEWAGEGASVSQTGPAEHVFDAIYIST